MKRKLFWTIDIGGTKILLVLIDCQEKVLFRQKILTPKPSKPQEVLNAISEKITAETRTRELEMDTELAGIGICTAGFVNQKEGIVYQSPNLDWHEPVPLGDLLKEKVNCPVIIENDTNAAVVGEVLYGAACGHKDVIYVTLSTGIGGGLFLNGCLYRGAGGFAGEIGHTKAFGQGRPCKCGNTDCLETWASGSAMARSAGELWDEKEVEGGHITTAWVFEQAAKGNNLAQSIIDHAAATTGLGLANLVTLFNPTCLVIGGGVAANRIDYFKKITEVIRKQSIKPAIEITSLTITLAALEPEAGIWGMYSLLTGQAK